MTTGKLATKTVDAIKPGRRDKFLWDTDLSGLGVRVTCGGAKAIHHLCRYPDGDERTGWQSWRERWIDRRFR